MAVRVEAPLARTTCAAWLACVLALLAAAGCGTPSDFGCTLDSQCGPAGSGAVCEATGACSEPDGTCPSQRRYVTHAPEGLAGRCVDPASADGGIDPFDGVPAQIDGVPAQIDGVPAQIDGVPAFRLEAPRASSAFAIDGSLDECVGVPKVTFRTVDRGTHDNSTTACVRWNDTHLYIAYQTSDTQIESLATDASGDVWQDDNLEVYLDVQHDEGAYASIVSGGDDVHLVTNLLGVAGGDLAFEHALHLAGTLNIDGDADSGYQIEVAIPWTSLGRSAAVGMTMGIDLCAADLDGGAGYVPYDWVGIADTPGLSYRTPHLYGDLVLAN